MVTDGYRELQRQALCIGVQKQHPLHIIRTFHATRQQAELVRDNAWNCTDSIGRGLKAQRPVTVQTR